MSSQSVQKVVPLRLSSPATPEETHVGDSRAFVDRSLAVGVICSVVVHSILVAIVVSTGWLQDTTTFTDDGPDPGDRYAEAIAYLPEEPEPEPQPLVEPEPQDEPEEEPADEVAQPEPAPTPEPPRPKVRKKEQQAPAPRVARKEAPAKPAPQVQEDRLVLPPSETGAERSPVAAPTASASHGAPVAPSAGTEPPTRRAEKPAAAAPAPAKPGPNTQALTRGYLRSINGLVKKKTRYPRQARRAGLQGKVIIKVVLDSKGQVLEVDLHTSSGHTLLDKAALKTVRSFSTFPAPPGELEWDKRTVLIPVRFKLK